MLVKIEGRKPCRHSTEASPPSPKVGRSSATAILAMFRVYKHRKQLKERTPAKFRRSRQGFVDDFSTSPESQRTKQEKEFCVFTLVGKVFHQLRAAVASVLADLISFEKNRGELLSVSYFGFLMMVAMMMISGEERWSSNKKLSAD